MTKPNELVTERLGTLKLGSELIRNSLDKRSWWTIGKKYIVEWNSNGFYIEADDGDKYYPKDYWENKLFFDNFDTIDNAPAVLTSHLGLVTEGDKLVRNNENDYPWWTIGKEYDVKFQKGRGLYIVADDNTSYSFQLWGDSNFMLNFDRPEEIKEDTRIMTMGALGKVTAGTVLRCTDSRRWFKQGRLYSVYYDAHTGRLCLRDDDGDIRDLGMQSASMFEIYYNPITATNLTQPVERTYTLDELIELTERLWNNEDVITLPDLTIYLKGMKEGGKHA